MTPPSDLDKLDARVSAHDQRLSALETSVGIIGNSIESQAVVLGDIKTSTSALGEGFRVDLRQMRQDDKEERKQERDANSQWWANAFKLAGSAIPLLVGLGGSGYYLTQAHAVTAPAAVEAPLAAPSP